MSMMSDRDIRLAMNSAKMPPNLRHLAPLRIIPAPADDQMQPCTIDLRLGNEFIYWKPVALNEDRSRVGRVQQRVEQPVFTLKPNQFVLATTLEYVEIPNWICAKVDGKSSLGRQGLAVHITAGLIDPGFKGMITLELKNLGYDHVRLDFGQKICQLEFHRLSSPVLRPYGHAELKSKYQGQVGVQEAR
jgi:dCTP deaminase